MRGAIRPGPMIPHCSRVIRLPQPSVNVADAHRPPGDPVRLDRPTLLGHCTASIWARGSQIDVTARIEPVGQRSETVRRANLSAIVRELHGRGPLSRSELVARTGLTRSAIRGLIGELTAAGIADERPAIPLGTRGRPSPLVRLEPERASVLALEIAVDSLAAALVGLGGNVLASIRVDRPRDHVSLEAIVGDLVALAERVLVPSRRRSAVIGVGVAVAGIVRRSDGFVWVGPNPGSRVTPLGPVLLDAPALAVPLEIANDADLGALAEVRRGAARGVDQVIYLSGEVGVGGGIIVDGRALAGVAGYGGGGRPNAGQSHGRRVRRWGAGRR